MCNNTCAFITFGCKVNQYESQVIRERLLREGFCEVEVDENPAFLIINTCTVTEEAFRESIRTVRKFAKNACYGTGEIWVTGCALRSNYEDFEKIPRVKVLKKYAVEDETITYLKGHTRAYIKVQDGCNLNCSFCIIPKVRGKTKSKKFEDVLREAEILAQNGYKEIVLTGIHLGSYGRDIYRISRFVELIEKILEIKGIERLRLSSLEVNEVTPGLIQLMRASRKLCPHLHIPLQSGDDKILRAMNRHYTAMDFVKRIDFIKSNIENCAITTDIIVGFPTEERRNFENTLEVCRLIGFSRMHIFPYSRREGTTSAGLSETVSPLEKKARLKELERLCDEMRFSFHKRFLGKVVSILVEDGNGKPSGYSERYIKTYVDGDNIGCNQIVDVVVKSVNSRFVIGEVL
jgi:threonylcarbamoyladenosine tRNA methylthiotransferase MtaB